MNAAATASIVVTDDPDGDASYLYQDGLGFDERREKFESGDFGFVGLYLEIDTLIPNGSGWIVHTVRTPGLWSIESDSGEDYFASAAIDEYDVLADMLAAMNVALPVNLDTTIRYR
jgi:hypothetical protein